jgi:hypothetical protein
MSLAKTIYGVLLEKRLNNQWSKSIRQLPSTKLNHFMTAGLTPKDAYRLLPNLSTFLIKANLSLKTKQQAYFSQLQSFSKLTIQI